MAARLRRWRTYRFRQRRVEVELLKYLAEQFFLDTNPEQQAERGGAHKSEREPG